MSWRRRTTRSSYGGGENNDDDEARRQAAIMAEYLGGDDDDDEEEAEFDPNDEDVDDDDDLVGFDDEDIGEDSDDDESFDGIASAPPVQSTLIMMGSFSFSSNEHLLLEGRWREVANGMEFAKMTSLKSDVDDADAAQSSATVASGKFSLKSKERLSNLDLTNPAARASSLVLKGCCSFLENEKVPEKDGSSLSSPPNDSAAVAETDVDLSFFPLKSGGGDDEDFFDEFGGNTILSEIGATMDAPTRLFGVSGSGAHEQDGATFSIEGEYKVQIPSKREEINGDAKKAASSTSAAPVVPPNALVYKQKFIRGGNPFSNNRKRQFSEIGEASFDAKASHKNSGSIEASSSKMASPAASATAASASSSVVAAASSAAVASNATAAVAAAGGRSKRQRKIDDELDNDEDGDSNELKALYEEATMTVEELRQRYLH